MSNSAWHSTTIDEACIYLSGKDLQSNMSALLKDRYTLIEQSGIYSETSLIGPPMGPMISGPISENLINTAIKQSGLNIKVFN